jgi:chorismate dehydratase
MLYSEVPLKDIEEIMLDYQSRTSVMLARVLAKDLWKISPVYIPAFKGYEQLIGGQRAAVVIGDRAFNLNGRFNYEYDLSEEWKKLTNMPFVFACWVSNKPLKENFIHAFNQALSFGINSIEEVARINEIPGVGLKEYFSKYISYEFSAEKHSALDLFLQKIKSL